MSVKKRLRPSIEKLEDRTTPAGFGGGPNIIGSVSGVLAVTPPAAQAPPQTVTIHQQVSSVTLPTGDVLPGDGLKTAAVHTPVVTWIPTGPAQVP